jgi:hypothetical protein
MQVNVAPGHLCPGTFGCNWVGFLARVCVKKVLKTFFAEFSYLFYGVAAVVTVEPRHSQRPTERSKSARKGSVPIACEQSQPLQLSWREISPHALGIPSSIPETCEIAIVVCKPPRMCRHSRTTYHATTCAETNS